jgi:hypothetical protein
MKHIQLLINILLEKKNIKWNDRWDYHQWSFNWVTIIIQQTIYNELIKNK